MVEFKTDGHGCITKIFASALDDVIIPAEISGEKITSIDNQCNWSISNMHFYCKSFSVETKKPLRISSRSLDGITASGNIDLSNIDFSENTFLEINLTCNELILPEITITRPANIKINANIINLSSKFCFNQVI